MDIHTETTVKNSNEEQKIIPKGTFLAHLNKNKSSLDLAYAKLHYFPESIYEFWKHLMFVYLEGNYLEYLPQNFFPSLPYLKWLDGRNNMLKQIPVTIANHQALEVLLLQGNQIQKLPLELGQVPKLRGLQLFGNPLIFPPEPVVSRGVQSILDFLHVEWDCQNTSIQPIKELFYDRVSHNGTKYERKSKSTSSINSRKKKGTVTVRPRTAVQSTVPVLSVKSCSLSHPRSWSKESIVTCTTKQEIIQQPFNTPDVLTENCHPGEVKAVLCKPQTVEEKIQQLWHRKKIIKMPKTLTDSMIQENHLRQMCIDRVQEMIEKQTAILQRKRDKEALKTWRTDKTFQRHKSAKEVSEPPFGTDSSFSSMPTRSEIRDGMRRKMKSAPATKMKSIDEEITEIFEMMKNLQGIESCDDYSLYSQDSNLQEINKLSEIQRRLQSVKLRNK